MKKIKLFALILCCIASVSFVSCSDNDDSGSNYQPPTTAQIKAAYESIKGSYTGKLVYPTFSTAKSSVLDTLDTSWEISNDSMLVIKDFPTKALASNITDAKLKEALANAPAQNLNCRFGFYQVDPLVFLINPKTQKYTLNYDGKTHEVLVVYYVNSSNSFGSINKDKVLQMQIAEGGIYVDGTLRHVLTQPIPILLKEETKS